MGYSTYVIDPTKMLALVGGRRGERGRGRGRRRMTRTRTSTRGGGNWMRVTGGHDKLSGNKSKEIRRRRLLFQRGFVGFFGAGDEFVLHDDAGACVPAEQGIIVAG